MKTLIKLHIILAIMIAATLSANAQGITVASYVEQTSVSPKLGYMLGYTFDSEIPVEVGAFFHNELMNPANGQTEFYNKRRETSFVGAYFNYPAVVGHKFDLYLQIRTGVVNKENFTITPSLEGRMKLTKQLHIATAVGTRCFRPTAMAKVAWTF